MTGSLWLLSGAHAVQVRSHVDSSTRFRGSGSGAAPVFVDQDQVRVSQCLSNEIVRLLLH